MSITAQIVIILTTLFVLNLLWSNSALSSTTIARRILLADLFSLGLLMTIWDWFVFSSVCDLGLKFQTEAGRVALEPIHKLVLEVSFGSFE